MVDRSMVLLLLLASLASDAQGVAVKEELEYSLVQNTSVILNSTECQVFQFVAPAAQFKVDIDVSKFPQECKLNETLSFTHDFYKQGQCIGYSLDHVPRCTVRLAEPEDVCANWGSLGSFFNGTNDVSVETSIAEDWECVASSYLLGFNSSCAHNATVGIQILAANLTANQTKACIYLDKTHETQLEILKKALIIAGATCALGCLLFSIMACCCCCKCCLLYQCCKGEDMESKESSLIEVLVPVSSSPVPSTPVSRPGSAVQKSSRHEKIGPKAK